MKIFVSGLRPQALTERRQGTAMEKMGSSRIFKIWAYTVSHGMLLIRSLGLNSEKNLDLVFTAVFYSELPGSFCGVEIDEPTPDEIAYLKTRYIGPFPKHGRFYVLCSGGKRYYVGAARLCIEANRLDGYPWDGTHEATVIWQG